RRSWKRRLGELREDQERHDPQGSGSPAGRGDLTGGRRRQRRGPGRRRCDRRRAAALDHGLRVGERQEIDHRHLQTGEGRGETELGVVGGSLRRGGMLSRPVCGGTTPPALRAAKAWHTPPACLTYLGRYMRRAGLAWRPGRRALREERLKPLATLV